MIIYMQESVVEMRFELRGGGAGLLFLFVTLWSRATNT